MPAPCAILHCTYPADYFVEEPLHPTYNIYLCAFHLPGYTSRRIEKSRKTIINITHLTHLPPPSALDLYDAEMSRQLDDPPPEELYGDRVTDRAS